MTKLTKAIREHILASAIAKSEIPGRRKKLEADLKVFGLKVYSEHVKVPPALQTLWDNPATRPYVAPFLTTAMRVEVSCKNNDFYYRNYAHAKEHSYCDRDRLPSTLKFNDPKLFPKNGEEFVIDGSALEPLAKELVTYHRETNAIEDELSNKIWAVLHSANTVAKLMLIWPEVEPLLPPVTQKTGSTALLPAQTILDVNKALGFSK